MLDNPSAKTDALLKKYEDVFSGNQGTMTHFCAKLNVKKDDQPIFLKPRSVPFAVKQTIKEVLKQLEAVGIIGKVPHSKWAAPIVPVPKGDGRMKLCGYYKVAVNQSLNVDQYPLPTPEDLFASLAGKAKIFKNRFNTSISPNVVGGGIKRICHCEHPHGSL